MEPKQSFLTTAVVFNGVYFSPRVNTSFQLSIYQVIFLNLKNLFSLCFSTFFPFHKLQLCSHIGKFWYIYVVGIRINKNPPRLFQPPSLPIISHWCFRPPCLLRPLPSVSSGPKSTLYKLELVNKDSKLFVLLHSSFQTVFTRDFSLGCWNNNVYHV